eukprot:1129492-Alexandrium_andersonii.AAC.1
MPEAEADATRAGAHGRAGAVPQLRGRIGGSCPRRRRRPTSFTRVRTAMPMRRVGSRDRPLGRASPHR